MPRYSTQRTNLKPGVFLRRWMSDTRGNYAIIFALTLVPILVAIGGAIDISQAYVTKQRLTRALDAAGLAVAGQTGLTNAQIQTMAQSYFNANYPAAKIGVPGTISVTTTDNTVNLTVNADMPTSLMGLVGIPKLNIAAKSQITRMGKKLEVALVLDTTGSMASSSKLSTLKTAAKSLLTTLQAAAGTDGDIKVAIVPFAVDVNVGTTYKNENWLKWTWTTPKTQTCSFVGWTYTCTDKAYSISKNSWQGCVIDRDQDYDIAPTMPITVTDASRYPADNDDCAPVTLLPLTSSWTTLSSKIDSLAANGNTNTTIGLVWGWQMLTQGAVLSNAAAANPEKLNKVIVYLTDGENTENRFTTSSSSIDARMSAACTKVKAAGIQIYTIRVMDGNATLLKNCASDASMYFSVTAASQLTTVFQTIAQTLSNLRISQ
ncbi:TadE/TadG family type IV pilus assembly protein [Parvibaculum sp.]|uniref:vWA domain-containing protein n=1 Tax=Parvibaculum sp. TaxID=2024848 RepID=UPI002BDE5D9B|nr:TadE/TadG family type IV pilus assembly protein [Parvibaculum sp.]HUD52974.1 TadE/TadG family type IV pilus assembly protein [Parvibaculum sp.]